MFVGSVRFVYVVATQRSTGCVIFVRDRCCLWFALSMKLLNPFTHVQDQGFYQGLATGRVILPKDVLRHFTVVDILLNSMHVRCPCRLAAIAKWTGSMVGVRPFVACLA